MAHFLSCHKKSLPTKQWLSSLIIVLNFMGFHKSWCLIDTLPCWQIWQSFTRKSNTKLIMSAARHPQIDNLIECVDETVRCYSLGFVFLDWVSHIPRVVLHYNFQPVKIRNIWSIIWISTSWLVFWLVIDTLALFDNHLFWLGKCLEYCSRVANTLQTIIGFSFFSTSRSFGVWWFSIPFFKGLHIHLCDQGLRPFSVVHITGLALYKLENHR